jgi:sugar/nucleoside kinase (ribokinase family)
MGAAGALVASREGILRLSHLAVEPTDTSGAGDAFLAGVLDSSARGHGWRQALLRGASAARLALFSPLSCPEALSPDALEALEDATVTEEALPA